MKKQDGGWLRKLFKAESITEALEKVPISLGLQTKNEKPESYTILQAFDMTLADSKRSDKRRWCYAVHKFLQWLNQNYPVCSYWYQLTRQIIREYLKTFDGKSPNTKQLALQPISQTSGYMSREFQMLNIAERLGIGSKIKNVPQKVYLRDVVDFCDYLTDINHRLEVGVALQGLAGLSLQEATRLTWDKVDLKKGLIEISGAVKNEYRNRVIPICSRVKEALERAKNRPIRAIKGRVLDLSDTVIVNRCGGAYGKYWINYSKEVRKLLKEWNPKIQWTTKDLRNALPTFAIMSGIHNDIWEQYISHAPRSVTMRHYVCKLMVSSQGEANELERQIELIRKQVTEPIESEISMKLITKIIDVI